MGLTARKVTTLKDAGRYGDGHGLYLQVTDAGVKSWLLRFERHGRERWMGLGPLHTVSLADARERARRARLQLLDGLDPIEARKAQRQQAALEAAKSMTLDQAAKEFLKQNEARWTSRKVRRQVAAQLDRFVFPVIGRLPVGEIDRTLILKVMEQRHADHDGESLWKAIPETANRLRGRLEEILDWASVRGFRSGENPAKWRGNLEHALPSPSTIAKTVNHPALPYVEMAQFIVDLRKRGGVSSRALEFTILCGSRAGEVLGAKWSEIDLGNRVWTVPSDRMKMDREHKVPLSDAAVELLQSLPQEEGNEFVFIGSQAGKGLGHAALGEALSRVRIGVTVHGFRSTFRDWCAERTGYAHEIAEAALAHQVDDKIVRAYRRTTFFDKRRELMQAWADYCSGKPTSTATSDNVVAMRA